MNTGLGFTIDWFDVCAGVFALFGVIGVGLVARAFKQLYEIEIGCDQGLYEGDPCRCPGIGDDLADPDVPNEIVSCRQCGRYAELGGE